MRVIAAQNSNKVPENSWKLQFIADKMCNGVFAQPKKKKKFLITHPLFPVSTQAYTSHCFFFSLVFFFYYYFCVHSSLSSERIRSRHSKLPRVLRGRHSGEKRQNQDTWELRIKSNNGYFYENALGLDKKKKISHKYTGHESFSSSTQLYSDAKALMQ